MRLSMTHHFPCTPDELWSVFDDPSFNERMSQRTGVVRELLEQRNDERGSYVKWKVIANKEVPAMMAKAIGADRISYEQESRRAAGSNTLAWTIIPMVLANKFTGSGTTTVRAAAGGSERVIEGDLVVKVPIIGKQMEQKLVATIEESYGQTAELALEMLKERAAGRAGG
jgi:hypothetical protein